MADHYIGERERRRLGGPILIGIVLVVLLFGSHYIASTFVDYGWWSELNQLDTWLNLLLYGTAPFILAACLLFAAFWTAFKLGIRHDGGGPLMPYATKRLVSRIGLAAIALLAIIVANLTVDSWTVVRYFGGLRLPVSNTFIDPIFGKPLEFYFFGLPFYNLLLRVVLTGAVISLLIFWLSSQLLELSRRLPGAYSQGHFTLDTEIRWQRILDSSFGRIAAALLLAGLAVKFYFNRYGLLTQDHGTYLVGVDWVADHVVLPLQWMMIGGALVAAALLLARRSVWALALLLLVPIRYITPALITGIYVRPNELSLERPYIQNHIEATRSAYGLNRKVKETHLEAQSEIPINYQKDKPLLDNVRLWDWRAFLATIAQIQPLRPYTYIDSDVDRYQIDGNLRQVLISARELQISQLGEAQNRWINTHLEYTHGYGIVMAEANRITPDGLPELFIKNAPPEISTPSLKLTRPEIYYGEVAHEPVFVDTNQPEFNYPSGGETKHTRYDGTGGFSIASPFMRLAAAIDYSDFNTLVTGYLTPQSRMMIRRAIQERVSTLAGFITWDSDPYLVLTSGGRLVWMIDGYMTSDAHPYSRLLETGSGTAFNYIRNSVKATVDAYTGETNMYVFDPTDVLIQAYWRLFPQLFKPESAMPADLRAHARYPETLFSAQAEIYRSFHMRDPENFYNRADLWDLAKTSTKQGESAASAIAPTYVVATLPSEEKPEFLLIIPFTPANKDNLIGFMSARCDGEHLGELVFEQLSKQNIVYGPMQIEARINQDQNISKDLTLWNQQGSQVIHGQTLVLPIENSFLYVAPIYIQASQASMPQLKKVALAMGNRLAYADTYEQSLAELISDVGGTGAGVQQTAAPQTTEGHPAPPNSSFSNAAASDATRTLQQVRDHLQRYRDLNSQGKWAEAGKELEAIQQLLNK
ncbi:MAG TPA: UPF0182 family protein [Bryobacteraceae bacterium]|jgi:hypothetical protein|nr:UPF0182 family protein [Bryobacteraceae bacterium]